MYCANCGEKIPAGAGFCPRCGKEVVPPEESEEESSLAAYVIRIQKDPKDQDAITKLYRASYKIAHNTAYVLVKTEDEMFDVIQNAFLKALWNINSLQDPKAFPGWYKRIVKNTALDALKKSGRIVLESTMTGGGEDGEENSIFDTCTPLNVEEQKLLESRFEEKEVKDLLDALLKTLPQSQQAMVGLRFYCDMKEKDIASQLGVAEGTVKSGLSRAMKSMRKKLEDYSRRTGTKLYGIAPAALLTWLFAQLDSKACTVPVNMALLQGVTAQFYAATKVAAATSAAATKSGAGAAAKAGAAAAGKSVAAKVVIGITCAAVAGGAGTAVVRHYQEEAAAEEATKEDPEARYASERFDLLDVLGEDNLFYVKGEDANSLGQHFDEYGYFNTMSSDGCTVDFDRDYTNFVCAVSCHVVVGGTHTFALCLGDETTPAVTQEITNEMEPVLLNVDVSGVDSITLESIQTNGLYGGAYISEAYLFTSKEAADSFEDAWKREQALPPEPMTTMLTDMYPVGGADLTCMDVAYDVEDTAGNYFEECVNVKEGETTYFLDGHYQRFTGYVSNTGEGTDSVLNIYLDHADTPICSVQISNQMARTPVDIDVGDAKFITFEYVLPNGGYSNYHIALSDACFYGTDKEADEAMEGDAPAEETTEAPEEKVSYLCDGETFQNLLYSEVSSRYHFDEEDGLVTDFTAVRRSDTEPDAEDYPFDFSDSGEPVFFWVEGDVLCWYSEADTI